MSETDRINTYVTLLKHCNLEVDWKGFAAEMGISLTGNAQRKVKEHLKKDGHQLGGGKVTPLEGKTVAALTPSKRKKKADSEENTPSKRSRKSNEKATEDESKNEDAEEESS